MALAGMGIDLSAVERNLPTMVSLHFARQYQSGLRSDCSSDPVICRLASLAPRSQISADRFMGNHLAVQFQ